MAIDINNDAVYRAAKPQEKKDGGGLSLLVKASGVKRWLFRYQYNGKPNNLGLGRYPDTTLANARQQAAEYRQQLAAESIRAKYANKRKRKNKVTG